MRPAAAAHRGLRARGHRLWARARSLAAILAAHAYTAVALADIGRFGWHFRGSIFDLAGLSDAHIASLPGEHGHKEWDEAYFRERSPELVLVLSSGDWEPPLDAGFRVRELELGVLRSIVTQGGYRYHAAVPVHGTRKLLVLVRDDLALDPELWGLPDERDVIAELRAFCARKLAAAN